MVRYDRSKHCQGPLTLWNVLPHEFCQPFPLLLLLLVAIVSILLDDPHEFIPQNRCRRRVAAREEFHITVFWAVTCPTVHLLQHHLCDKSVVGVSGEKEAISDEGLVQMFLILDNLAGLILRNHV